MERELIKRSMEIQGRSTWAHRPSFSGPRNAEAGGRDEIRPLRDQCICEERRERRDSPVGGKLIKVVCKVFIFSSIVIVTVPHRMHLLAACLKYKEECSVI